jgi:hypothetical protein
MSARWESDPFLRRASMAIEKQDLFVILIIVGLFLGLAWAIYDVKQREARCEARGGVYFRRESKCITGVKELK